MKNFHHTQKHTQQERIASHHSIPLQMCQSWQQSLPTPHQVGNVWRPFLVIFL